MDKEESEQHRTIGLHPCVGKKVSGEERPTVVVIRTPDGSYESHEFDEQQLLDFFTCGAAVAWRNATIADLEIPRPSHHQRWAASDAQSYAVAGSVEGIRLFRIQRKHATGEIVGHFRLQVPAALISLNPAMDTVGVANNNLGYQVMEVLLGRFPSMDVRTIGSGPLKDYRAEVDALLPAALRRKVEKVRAAATETMEANDESDAANTEDDEVEEPRSKSAVKDANAKFDAHRIAYALADAAASKVFHHCTLRDRDWAAVYVAYGRLEVARKARTATQAQFRGIHRAELRRLVKDPRVPFVSLGGSDEDDQSIEALLASYEATLRIAVTSEKDVAQRLAVLQQACDRIEGARKHEAEMERHLDHALGILPEYTEFLSMAKAQVHPETGLPLGKYIGGRIFGRWIAGFGSPMSSRINEPMRQSDRDRIAACKRALTDAIVALERTGLPEQPPSGNGKTREWLLACERIARARIAQGSPADAQLAQILICRDAYRRLMNAEKCAKHRSRNRAIAFMGLHVRHGGKYEGTPKDREFPRRRKGSRANWDEQLLRQGAVQWVTLIIKGGDSHWKSAVYQPTKAKRIAAGEKKIAAHRDAFWRTATVAMRWLLDEWFQWERKRAVVEATKQAA